MLFSEHVFYWSRIVIGLLFGAGTFIIIFSAKLMIQILGLIFAVVCIGYSVYNFATWVSEILCDD